MDTNPIETDDLALGAGAAAMAFVDTLLGASDSQIVMADRSHRPGGRCRGKASGVDIGPRVSPMDALRALWRGPAAGYSGNG